MLSTLKNSKQQSEVPIQSGRKVYTMKKPDSSSGVGSEKKALLAKIILVICIILLIAAKGFGS